jgi:hypothetical protein
MELRPLMYVVVSSGCGEVLATRSASRRRRGEIREVVEDRPRFERRGEVLVHQNLDDVERNILDHDLAIGNIAR